MSDSGDERRRGQRGGGIGRRPLPQQQQQQGRRRRRNENSQSINNTSNEEKELATQLLTIQSKRFYIDVKENQRGRFLKLVEASSSSSSAQGGRRNNRGVNRILMSMSVANEFKQKLHELSELNSSLGPQEADNESKQNDGLIRSEELVRDNKRYYFDLRENQRGRFLRVTQVITRGPRASIGKFFFSFDFLIVILQFQNENEQKSNQIINVNQKQKKKKK